MKAEEPPSLEMPTATLAGAPPGAFLKAGASASETPPTVGTKSIKTSPKQTTGEFLTCNFPSNPEERSLISPVKAQSNLLEINSQKEISDFGA